MRLPGLGGLALALLVARPASGEDLPVVVTKLGGPFLNFYDSLTSEGDGILFQTPGNPSDITERPGAWFSKGTVASTRRLSVPGYPNNLLLGYRGPHVFLQTWGPDLGPPYDVVSLDRRTGRVTRLRPGFALPGTAADSGFYFVLYSGAEPGLYRSDGTLAGTRRILSEAPDEIVSLGRDVVFWLSQPGPLGMGLLYRAGAAGVQLLGEFAGGEFPSVDPFGTPMFRHLGVFGPQAAFWEGDDLWVTDGTPEGTRSVPSFPLPLFAGSCGGQLLVFPVSAPTEVWATDGTPNGTHLLSSSQEGYVFQSFGVADAGTVCYFLTGSSGSPRLWKTDLTPAGTSDVMAIDYPSSSPPAPWVGSVGARGRVYFPKYKELWTSDGTEAGTRRLAAGLPYAPSHMVRAGGRLFFATFTDEETPLWVADLPPALIIEDAEGFERPRGAAVSFRVRLSRRSDQEITVGFETEAGTAKAGEDFLPAAGTLRFAPGERSKSIRVPIVFDGVAEGPEAFRVRLLSPSGAEIERGRATGTIRDPAPGIGPRR